MTTEIEFVNGLIVKAPRDGAPEYVLANLSIKRADLIAWLSSRNDDWINVECKVAKSGKAYAAVDSWKPKGAEGGGTGPTRRAPVQAPSANEEYTDDIPFISSACRIGERVVY